VAQKVSYAWALLLEQERYRGYLDSYRASARRQFVNSGRMSEDVFESEWKRLVRGLGFAQNFARAVRVRRAARLLARHERQGLAPDQRGLTPRELASLRGVSLKKMAEAAHWTRWSLFGDAADRTIRHRLSRFAEVSGRAPRYCEIAGCTNELPRRSRSTRKRCDACRASGRRRQVMPPA
jgi:hypothetical protein